MDIIHRNRFPSIYVRTDYIVNSDMTIPFALARGLVASMVNEAARRTGLPPVSRESQPTPLAFPRGRLPVRK